MPEKFRFLSPASRKNKVILVITIVILIALIIAGLFLLRFNNSPRAGQKELLKNAVMGTDGYVIEEAPEGKIVQNKDEKIALMAPYGWIVKKYKDELDILSPETKFGDDGGIKISAAGGEKVCGMALSIIKSQKTNSALSTYADDIQSEINYLKSNGIGAGKNPEKNILKIGGEEAVKNTYMQGNAARMFEIFIPMGQTVFSFSTGFLPDEKCAVEIEKILDTVIFIKNP